MDLMFWILVLLKILLGILLLCLSGFVGIPLLLAAITIWRRRNQAIELDPNSSLYVGRVWHTRLQPTHHAFQYPLFLFALDLEEVDDLFLDRLWPLSLIVQFRNVDHLKNGEGLTVAGNTNSTQTSDERNVIATRVLQLVAEKTNHSFQPKLATHRVIIVTHLCYYGYCFNPVSFYYVQEKNTNKLVTVVGEVSNTPWNEMHCYVLHPDSVDNVTVKSQDEKEDHQQSINYKFPKCFHVSPFMEMNYIYDWTFTNFQLQSDEEPLNVRTAMKKGENEVHFTAVFECSRQGIQPMTVAWQLIYYPIYCFIIQVWIHYEAFWLFAKGVVFVPHPNASETAASRAIAAIMTPLFAFKDWVNKVTGKSSPEPKLGPDGNATKAKAKKS